MDRLNDLIRLADEQFSRVAAYTPPITNNISFSVYFRESALLLNDYYSFIDELELNKIGVGTNYRLNTLECPLCKTVTSLRPPSVVQDRMSSNLRRDKGVVIADSDGSFTYTVQDSKLDYPKVMMMASHHLPQYNLILSGKYLKKIFTLSEKHSVIIHVPGKDNRRFPITHAYAYLTRRPTIVTQELSNNPDHILLNSNSNFRINHIVCRVFRYEHLSDIYRDIHRYITGLVRATNPYSSETTDNISLSAFRLSQTYFIIVYLTNDLIRNKGSDTVPILWQLTPYTGIVEIDEAHARNIVSTRDSSTTKDQIHQIIAGDFSTSYLNPPDISNPIFDVSVWEYRESMVLSDMIDALKKRKYDVIYDLFLNDKQLASKAFFNSVVMEYILKKYDREPDIRAFLMTRWLRDAPNRLAHPDTIGFFVREARRTFTEFRIDSETFIDGFFSNKKKASMMHNLPNTSLGVNGYSLPQINEWLSVIRRTGDVSSFGMVYAGNVGAKIGNVYQPNIPIVIKGLLGSDSKIISKHNYDNNLPSFVYTPTREYIEETEVIHGVRVPFKRNWKQIGYRPINEEPNGLLVIARLTTDDLKYAKYEADIGLKFINMYRAYIPNFMMTYGYIICPTYVPNMQKPNTKAICVGGSAGSGTLPEPFILVESFGTREEEAKSSKHLIVIESNIVDTSEKTLRAFVQLFSALQIAREINKFKHNDLHSKNVMYVKTPQGGGPPGDPTFRYVFSDNTHIDVLAPFFCMVIDFGTAETINYNPYPSPIAGKRWMWTTRAYLPDDPNLDDPTNDIWTYLFSMFIEIIRLSPDLVVRGNYPNQYFDPTKSKIAEFYKVLFDAYKGGMFWENVFPEGDPDLSPNTTNLFVDLMRTVHEGVVLHIDAKLIGLYRRTVQHHPIQPHYTQINASRMRYKQTYNGSVYDLSTHKGVALLANAILNQPSQTHGIRYLFGMDPSRNGRIIANPDQIQMNRRRSELKDLTNKLAQIGTVAL
jgi:hypothetical protein